jgi:plasmid maintenance system killer protein
VWAIFEEPEAQKAANKLPPNVAKKYALWAAIVRQSGPQGLRSVKGFHDEKLAGKLGHLRSSRLNEQWRVLYSSDATTVTVSVVRITPHDYRP